MNTTPRKFYAAEDGNNPYPGCKILTAENPNGQNSTSSGQPDKKLSIYKDGVIYEDYYTSGISHSFDLKLICLDHCFKDGQNVTGLYTKRYEVDISAGNGKWEPVSAEYFNTCKDEYRRVIAIPTSDKKLTHFWHQNLKNFTPYSNNKTVKHVPMFNTRVDFNV